MAARRPTGCDPVSARGRALGRPYAVIGGSQIFRLTKGGKLNREIFEGATINTPSMLCVEDYLDALAWAESIGGLDALIARSDRNAQAVTDWVERTPWIDFLAVEAQTRSKHVGLPARGRSGNFVALS